MPSGHSAFASLVFALIKHPHLEHCFVVDINRGQDKQIEYLSEANSFEAISVSGLIKSQGLVSPRDSLHLSRKVIMQDLRNSR